MIRLQPDWVGELVSLWSASDWSEARERLDYPSVSPMFARAIGSVTEAEDPTGYGSAELRAMSAAIEWLQLRHPEHWRALSREFRSWTRKSLPEKSGDTQLVLEAGKLLADYIDKVLG